MNQVIADTETIGGNPKASKITEIAIYKYNGVSIIDEFSSLVDHEMKIPEFIVRLTEISDSMVETCFNSAFLSGFMMPLFVFSSAGKLSVI